MHRHTFHPMAFVQLSAYYKIFLMTSLYLSALSGNMVTTTPSSISLIIFNAPAIFAAEEGLNNKPSCLPAARMISYASSVLTSIFLSATRGHKYRGTMAVSKCFHPSKPCMAESGWKEIN